MSKKPPLGSVSDGSPCTKPQAAVPSHASAREARRTTFMRASIEGSAPAQFCTLRPRACEASIYSLTNDAALELCEYSNI